MNTKMYLNPNNSKPQTRSDSASKLAQVAKRPAQTALKCIWARKHLRTIELRGNQASLGEILRLCFGVYGSETDFTILQKQTLLRSGVW